MQKIIKNLFLKSLQLLKYGLGLLLVFSCLKKTKCKLLLSPIKGREKFLFIPNRRFYSTSSNDKPLDKTFKKTGSIYPTCPKFYNMLRTTYINLTMNPYFPIYFALIIGLLVFIYNFVDWSEVWNSNIIYAQDAEDNGKPVKFSGTGNVYVSLTEAAKATGIGYGAAKMIQACPPNSRLAATIGLGSVTAASQLVSKALEKANNSDTDSPKGGGNINSSLEWDIFNSIDSMNPELVLLYCCLLFMILALYFFIGLLVNVVVGMYLKSDRFKRLEKNKVINYLYRWLNYSNYTLVIIISFIILYSLTINMFILFYLINHFDQFHPSPYSEGLLMLWNPAQRVKVSTITSGGITKPKPILFRSTLIRIHRSNHRKRMAKVAIRGR